MTIEGGCRCGAVRYTIAGDAMPATYLCHCTICQRATGSSFAHQMPIPEASLTVVGDTVRSEVTNPSGAVATNHYCPRCYSRLYNVNSSRPGLAIVRAGTIDGSEHLSPRLHIYTSTKQPWIVLPDDVPAFVEAPPPEEFVAIMTR